MLSIVKSLKRFRVYLTGIHFKIVTDCNSLKCALEKKEINARIYRWSQELQHFDYTLDRRRGERMKHVDALSRNSILLVQYESLSKTLAIKQGLDIEITKIRDQLEKSEHKLFELKTVWCSKKKMVNQKLHLCFMFRNVWKIM